MDSRQSPDHLPSLTRVQWLICIIACIGFAFDSYELLMLPLILPRALLELGGLDPNNPATAAAFANWRDLMFYVPALAGGLFGLLGGYLTDLFGRRKVLVWSILLYAFSACAAGYANSLPMLLVLRCTTFIGVCVEFVAAVAWLAELFPHGKQREKILGYTQAFSSLGGVMVTGANWLAATYGEHLPAIFNGHAAWRYTLISGVIPAIPLILIRPFLPESPIWKEQKAAGTLRRPSLAEIFQPAFRKTTLVTTLLVACAYGAAYGAIQQTPQMVRGLPEVVSEVSTISNPQQKQQRLEQLASGVQSFQETGGLVGRIALAILAVVIWSRRKLLRIFQIPGLLLIPLVFFFPATNNIGLLKWGIFLTGFFTVAQFSFWGNYLPRVYPTYLRGTGESFAANIGGRMIGTAAALLTTQLAKLMPGATAAVHLAYAAGCVAFLVYAIGLIASFYLPEPTQEDLPE
ncbi:MAG: MFS transporter [Acidobacteria bacterium]|nr:MFS transporter [Acidobacteriota bacterium]